MSNYLFVYGTLQPHCVPAKMASVVEKLQSIGPGFLHGTLYDLGGYPGAVPDPALTQRITGTVLKLPQDPSLMQLLDAYEGFDPRSPDTSEFIREVRRVQVATGDTIECWFYRYNRKPDPLSAIRSGKWQK